MPLPHSTPYFSPNTVVSRIISIHQHRIRELAEPRNMKLHTADVTMETLQKTSTRHSPKPYCCCLRCVCPPTGLMASPQLGPSSISSWVKSVVAPSGLTRHEAGDGSCNRDIRVVLGVLLIPCIQHQLANLSSLLLCYIPTLRRRSTEPSVVYDNM